MMTADTVAESTGHHETPAEAMAALGLTVAAEFVPLSQSRNADKIGKTHGGLPSRDPLAGLTLNWRVTLRCGDRDILIADYSAGCGHCPSYRQTPPQVRVHEQVAQLVRLECEHGKPAKWSGGMDRAYVPEGGPFIMPDQLDVMHSLLLDAEVLDYPGFEDWAKSLGYDPDSRKAEAIYRECLEIALKLRSGIGDAAIERLQAAFQDY